MRTKLKQFRVGQHMSQEEFAQKLGYTRFHFGRIENGSLPVSMKFWDALKDNFNLSDNDIRELTKRDGE